jgi:hypothetical protein
MVSKSRGDRKGNRNYQQGNESCFIVNMVRIVKIASYFVRLIGSSPDCRLPASGFESGISPACGGPSVPRHLDGIPNNRQPVRDGIGAKMQKSGMYTKTI